MPGHAQDMQVAVADLECEQDVEPSQSERAIDVEVDRERALAGPSRASSSWSSSRQQVESDATAPNSAD